jgi:hypothetical protein
MAKQQVSLGVTQSGQHGLFTGGFLAFPLTKEQYERFADMRPGTKDALKAFCEQRGFELVEA